MTYVAEQRAEESVLRTYPGPACQGSESFVVERKLLFELERRAAPADGVSLA